MRGPATGAAAADGDFVLHFARGEFVVSAECVFPVENPVAFGGESVPIRVRTLHVQLQHVCATRTIVFNLKHSALCTSHAFHDSLQDTASS